MKINRLVIFVLAIGFVSSVAIIYFYTLQRDFTKNHREFLISVNKLNNLHGELINLVLQNSIYKYNDQDSIASWVKKIEDEYDYIANTKILQDKDYKSVKSAILEIQQKFQTNIQNIEDYQMLNASIKNSLLFLTRHVENAGSIPQNHINSLEYKNIFIESSKILKRFLDTKEMQDLDYIHGSDFLLESDAFETEIRDFIENFNMHSNYLVEKYPLYLNYTKQALDGKVYESIENIRDEFSKIALNDFKALDTFAFILFSVFILSLATIIVLFIKYIKENRHLVKTKESLEHSLRYDYLTDLYNRKALEAELQSIEKPHILLINIDGFKHINDIYGNDVGNQVLKELAKLIKIKVSDKYGAKLYRLGGDEFGVLFSDIKEDKALQIAECIEDEIAKHKFRSDDLTLQIFVSISSNNIYPIIENADLALKLIKNDHTRKVSAYKESLNIKKSVEENLKTVELIKRAIEDDRIVPFFQPIVNLQSSKIEKYEALVRLKLEDGSFLSPFKFLETSKKTPYYRDITKIMIQKTLETLERYPQYRFSINISMIDILDDEIVEVLFSMLQSNKSAASRFDIEFLESENMQDISKVQNFIKNIKQYGSNILIDDFGSGYSNFSYFSEIEVDIIKIDGSITKEITTSERKLHMLKSIYQFSKGMNMLNVAEFVETREMALLLKEIGVEYAQGYYFSQPLEKPLDSDEVII